MLIIQLKQTRYSINMAKELTDEFLKNKTLKSFIRVGQTFIDIKQTIGFSFMEDPQPGGYIIVQFVYDSGRALNAFIRNRNEFSQFLLELEPFIDDEISLKSMEGLIEEIERSCNKQNVETNKYMFKPRRNKQNFPRKRNNGNNLENENQ